MVRAGGTQNLVVAPVQDRVVDVRRLRIEDRGQVGSRLLAQAVAKAAVVGRPKILGEIVDLQQKRISCPAQPSQAFRPTRLP